MHLPGPFRAAVGLVASAAEEAKHLPDRAIELPMLAVSSALQMSLRAQQRYARLTARGDQVLSRSQPGDEPPEWATFDEPVSLDELHRSALAKLDGLAGDAATSRMLEDLFGVDSPDADSAESLDDGPQDGPDNVTPIENAKSSTAKKSAPAKKTDSAKNASSAKKKTTSSTHTAPVKKTLAKGTASVKKPATGTTSSTAKKAASGQGKTVNKPRHTAPSKFDDVDG